MKNSERQAVMLNGYQSFSFGSSICSPVLSAGNQNRFKAPRKNLGALLFSPLNRFKAPRKNLGALLFSPQSKRKGFIFSSRIFYRCSFLHFDNRESQKL